MPDGLQRRPTRLLMVEDSEDDARRLYSQLAQANADLIYRRVECAEEMRAALAESEWDMVIIQGAETRQAVFDSDVRVHKLAFYDALTGLPNRNRFCDYVAKSLLGSRSAGPTLFVLDVDRFLRFNNCFGYKTGDALITQIGARLQACVPPEGMVARLGSDVFAAFLPQLSGAEDARSAAEKIRCAFGRPFSQAGLELYVTVSIGMAVSPQHGVDMAELLINAETAMYRAKALGGGHYQFYSPSMAGVSEVQWKLESALHGAAGRGELLLEYQPLVEVASGRVTGVEALVRWRHPQLGVLPPDRFIPLANESGLIVEIGEWVLKTACCQAKAWHDAGHAALSVAVNVSAVQFWQPGLLQFVAGVLAETGIDPRCLELEITESVLMQDADATIAALQALKRMNVRISIDDFGTGYSSLSYLKRFPIDILKIDRVFSSDVLGNAESAAIVQAITALAKSLSLVTVAEGVETADQLEFFRRHRCERVQGYLFSEPRAADEITAMLAGV